MRIILPTKKKLLLLAFLSLEFANAQTISQTFNATSTFTVPIGVTSVTAEAFGGGGKGGSRSSGSNGGYGGGGGGAYARSVVPVVPGTTYTVTVGTGSTSSASSGGDSWFINSSTILAKGGSSAANDSSTGAAGGAASASIGTIKFNGGNGSNGVTGSYGGGGGSSAGNDSNGTNTTNSNGATAPTGGGNGGNGRLSTNGNGSIGIAPGGGGGGSLRTTGTTIGGDGGNGKVILTYNIPEIDITGNATSIINGSLSPSLLDSTDFGTTNVGVGFSKTFTIYNTSTTAPLSVGAISISGTNASDFTVTSNPSSEVAIESSTTFAITFTPSAIGLRTATISIVNNDTDENPYTFSIQGTANGAEIDIQGNLTSIINGDSTPATTDWTDFSTVALTRTFTILNIGNQNLSVDTVTITGTDASDFSIINYPSSIILPGQSTTLSVRFLPSAIGTKNATITISNADFNESSYTFSIKGTGVLPSMIVKGNNTLIADGDTTPSISDWTDLQSTNIGSPITRVYTIENIGNMELNLTGTPNIAIIGADFSISTQPSISTISGLNSTTFIVTFNPTSLGIKTAEISIANNDSSVGKNPYTFRISCEAIEAFLDNDGDGIIDNIDKDDDNDGIPDSVEQNYASHSVLGTSFKKVLLNETFGVGTTRTRINSNVSTALTTYCYEDGTTSQAIDECDTVKDLNDGQYTINYKAGSSAVASWAPTHWYQGPDHTIDTNGRMALFNATNDITDEFYRTIVQGVTANAPLTYSFWILNLDRTDTPGIGSRNRPNISVEFRDLSNNLISTISTGDIAPTSAENPNGDWKPFSATFIPVTTGFSIVFRNNQPGGLGNDLALDDIMITQELTDSDQDGLPDVYDLDSDNDGIGGIIEDGWSTLSNGKDRMDLSSETWIDANANGWHDIPESYYVSNHPANFDGDLMPNYIDLDSDNDAVFDVDEAGLLNGDGDVNCDGEGEGTDTDNDGILAPFDTLVGYGNSGKSLPTNTLGIGNPDYLNLASKNAGIFDISTTLYANLDTNNDGVIDGTTDIDRDGILDALDTNTGFYGSPRDLNRKLFLDFDGRNDYGQDTPILGGLSNASLMAWINLNSAFSGDGIIIGQDKFQLRINSSKKLEAVVNGTTLTYTNTLNTQQWYNVAAVYGDGFLKLYLNGNVVKSVAKSGNIATDASLLTIGKNPIANNKFFKGKIDEVRVFNVALTESQLQRMVYQEIQNTSSQVRGAIIPKDIGSLPFANLLRYYRMDVYKNDIIDNLSTPAVDLGTGMKIFNNKNIYKQQAPMPFITERSGDLATAVNSPSNEVRGLDINDQDWSIVQVKHDITETSDVIDLGMLVDSDKSITMNNDTKIQNDWYLKLDGKINLEGKSQLLQTLESDLDETSSGSLKRDQQGSSNLYNYNYWSSPVGTINNTTNNNDYSINDVMKDGTTTTPQNIIWTSNYNGSPTSPITLSSYWVFKFQNLGNAYANWQYVGPNGTLSSAQGFTLKGCGSTNPDQNYTFVGKPNNGTITYPITPNNVNLSGNPYSSAIDANNFINDNLTSTTGTLYFWEHYNTNNTHILADYQGGYATRNLVGGTPPISPPDVSGLGSSTKVPGQYVPVGQGFFVVGSTTGGTVTFNNGQRDFIKENESNSNTMFKNNSHINNNNTQYKKIRLGFTSNNNYHRQILLGFMENLATSGIDSGYDAIYIDNQPSDMYFINNNTKLSIQGEGSFDNDNIYPIGVKTNTSGNVTFMVDGTEKMNNKKIYIYDNTTNIYYNITNNPLTINLPQGTFENRFSLRFKKHNNQQNSNHKNGAEKTENAIIVFAENNKINIQNNNEEDKIKSIELFNMLGQSIAVFEIENQNQNQIELPRNNISTGNYIIKMITEKNNISRKIVFN